MHQGCCAENDFMRRKRRLLLKHEINGVLFLRKLKLRNLIAEL